MSTIRANTIVNMDGVTAVTLTGLRPARAWARYDGTPTVDGSFNISSVTSAGTGTHYASFSSSMIDSNFGNVIGKQNLSTNSNAYCAPTINSIASSRTGDIQCFENGSSATPYRVYFAIFR